MPTKTHSHLSRPPCEHTALAGHKTSEKRIKIDLQNPFPYKWICHLRMIVNEGKIEYGTGFLINIPGSNKCVVLTAAHVLYHYVGFMGFSDKSGYMKEVMITFPSAGENTTVSVGPESLRVHQKFKDFKSRDYDFGIIILPDEKLPKDSCGFGFNAVLTDRELLASDLSLFGYPYFDKPEEIGTMWGSGGHVQSLDDRMVRFMVSTTGGQSGSPVIIWNAGVWTVVGVHVHEEMVAGEVINAAVRVSTSMMNTITTWIKHEYVGVSLRFDTGDFLSIPIAAPKELGEYAEIETRRPGLSILTESDVKPTKLNIIPVRSFPEGCARPYSDNLWVISTNDIDKENTYLSIDQLANKAIPWPRKPNIVASSRLKESPIVDPSSEVVYFGGHCTVPEDTKPLGIKSLKFPKEGNDPTFVWIEGHMYNLSSLVVTRNVPLPVITRHE